ncbi:WRKY domain [Sesbania bispinosa]|nr:WRKY domain [Sesbania bispinosa]
MCCLCYHVTQLVKANTVRIQSGSSLSCQGKLMKIKLELVIVGAGFSYSLIILRSSFSSINSTVENEQLGLQDQRIVMNCVEELRKNNSNLTNMLLQRVKKYLNGNSELVVTDHNFMIDVLPRETMNNLHETAKLMLNAGLQKECSDVYSTWQKEWLEECLINKLLRLKKVGFQDYMIGRLIKTFKVALRILFPSERRLCNHVFMGFSSTADLCFLEVCHGAAIQLLNFADEFFSLSPSAWHLFKTLDMFDTLREMIPEFESLFPDSLVNEAKKVENRLGEASRDIFMDFGYLIFHTPDAEFDAWDDGRVHLMTCGVLGYLVNAFWLIEYKLGTLFGDERFKENTGRYLELYHRSSWNKVLDTLHLDSNETVASNVAAESMKEKLNLFNLHFREMCSVQSTWLVFDKELRNQIIVFVENLLLPAYANFIGRFHDVLGKHPDEYIEYGMSDIQDRLNHLFLRNEMMNQHSIVAEREGIDLCHLFGEWNFFKIIFYTVVSLSISSVMLFLEKWKLSRRFMLKAHSGVLVLLLTSFYSFVSDKAVNGKPDLLTLISFAAFALMSLCLSKQIELGFGVDLLNFFLGCLTVQLMKINLVLSIVAAILCHSLMVVRSKLDSQPKIGTRRMEDHVAVEIDAADGGERGADHNRNHFQSDYNIGPQQIESVRRGTVEKDDNSSDFQSDYTNDRRQIQSLKNRMVEDGYNWKKYEEKQVNKNVNLRSYYKCTSLKCPSLSPMTCQINHLPPTAVSNWMVMQQHKLLSISMKFMLNLSRFHGEYAFIEAENKGVVSRKKLVG